MRQSAVQTLNAWVEQTGLAVFVEAELLADSLKQENPNLRAEVNAAAFLKVPMWRAICLVQLVIAVFENL
jgi:hypothetical protein